MKENESGRSEIHPASAAESEEKATAAVDVEQLSAALEEIGKAEAEEAISQASQIPADGDSFADPGEEPGTEEEPEPEETAEEESEGESKEESSEGESESEETAEEESEGESEEEPSEEEPGTEEAAEEVSGGESKEEPSEEEPESEETTEEETESKSEEETETAEAVEEVSEGESEEEPLEGEPESEETTEEVSEGESEEEPSEEEPEPEETTEEETESKSEEEPETAEAVEGESENKSEEKLEEEPEELGTPAEDAETTAAEKSKSRRKKALIAIIIIVVAVIAACLAVVKTGHITVNGIRINAMSEEKALEELADGLHEEGYIFADSELDETYVTYEADLSEVFDGSSAWISFVKRESYEVEIQAAVDTAALETYIDEYNETATKSVNAYIKNGDTIVEEVVGDRIAKKKLLAAIEEGATGIALSDYYKLPEITAADLEEVLATAESYRSWTCTYTNGNVLEIPDEAIEVSKKGKITINKELIAEQVEALTEDYCTVNEAIEFTTHSGEVVELSSSYWGEVVEAEAEAKALVKLMKAGETVTDREPITSGQDKIVGDTYVEVSISDQHVWVYVDGEMIMDTACTTGKSGHNTPTGAYYILEKVNGKWLTGDGYRSWVNKWMRCTWTGIGLHDATWRSKFGGSNYLSNGSHGCVNLPYDFAVELYDIAYVGMPVMIY